MMIENVYTLSNLFKQLGLSGKLEDIDEFIAQHRLPNEVNLADAAFWTPSQASFLREGLLQDANWAPAIEELNVCLHN